MRFPYQGRTMVKFISYFKRLFICLMTVFLVIISSISPSLAIEIIPLAKNTHTLEVEWAKPFMGEEAINYGAVEALPQNGIVFVKIIKSTSNPGVTPVLIRMDSNGNILWEKGIELSRPIKRINNFIFSLDHIFTAAETIDYKNRKIIPVIIKMDIDGNIINKTELNIKGCLATVIDFVPQNNGNYYYSGLRMCFDDIDSLGWQHGWIGLCNIEGNIIWQTFSNILTRSIFLPFVLDENDIFVTGAASDVNDESSVILASYTKEGKLKWYLSELDDRVHPAIIIKTINNDIVWIISSIKREPLNSKPSNLLWKKISKDGDIILSKYIKISGWDNIKAGPIKLYCNNVIGNKVWLAGGYVEKHPKKAVNIFYQIDANGEAVNGFTIKEKNNFAIVDVSFTSDDTLYMVLITAFKGDQKFIDGLVLKLKLCKKQGTM